MPLKYGTSNDLKTPGQSNDMETSKNGKSELLKLN